MALVIGMPSHLGDGFKSVHQEDDKMCQHVLDFIEQFKTHSLMNIPYIIEGRFQGIAGPATNV